MFALLVLFICSVSCSGIKPTIAGGGLVVNRSQFAYQVSLLYKSAPFCGGAIIDERHILTAAQCCQPKTVLKVHPSELTIVAGSLDLYDFSLAKAVEFIFVHEDFDLENYYNDIALIRILGQFHFTPNIQPITLNTLNAADDDECTVSGWGADVYNTLLLSPSLRFAQVEILGSSICQNARLNPGPGTICARGTTQNFCDGDEGSPLVCNDLLTGIASYSYGCVYENMPGVYTNVAKYVEWIETQKRRTSSTSTPHATYATVLIFNLVAQKIMYLCFNKF